MTLNCLSRFTQPFTIGKCSHGGIFVNSRFFTIIALIREYNIISRFFAYTCNLPYAKTLLPEDSKKLQPHKTARIWNRQVTKVRWSRIIVIKRTTVLLANFLSLLKYRHRLDVSAKASIVIQIRKRTLKGMRVANGISLCCFLLLKPFCFSVFCRFSELNSNSAIAAFYSITAVYCCSGNLIIATVVLLSLIVIKIKLYQSYRNFIFHITREFFTTACSS